MDVDGWVRNNKKKIAREILQRIALEPHVNPSGIFTAGLPGSGKTEFTTELIQELAVKPLRIDMDELASLIEGYRPQLADMFRKGASSILTELYTKVLREHGDFVFDGTLAHDRALLNIQRAIKRGYTIKVYYIHQDPVVAWQFTKDRELVERRGIKKEGFIESYLGLYKNLRILQASSLPLTISVVVKDANNKVIARHENVADIFAYTERVVDDSELARVIIE